MSASQPSSPLAGRERLGGSPERGPSDLANNWGDQDGRNDRYAPPRINVIGAVSEFTLGSSGPNGDGVGGLKKERTPGR